MTSLATQSMIALIQIVIVIRILKISLKSLPLLQAFFYLLLFVPISIVTFKYLHVNSLWQFLSLGVISLILAFATNLLSLKFLKEFNFPTSHTRH